MQGPSAEQEHPAEPVDPDPAQLGGASAGLKRCVASFDCRERDKEREERRKVGRILSSRGGSAAGACVPLPTSSRYGTDEMMCMS